MHPLWPADAWHPCQSPPSNVVHLALSPHPHGSRHEVVPFVGMDGAPLAMITGHTIKPGVWAIIR